MLNTYFFNKLIGILCFYYHKIKKQKTLYDNNGLVNYLMCFYNIPATKDFTRGNEKLLRFANRYNA